MVFNYLKYLNEIDKKNLFFYNLNEKLKEFKKFYYNNIYIDSNFINETEGSILLNKYFDTSDKSYHQIYIYVKVLADQLRKFSNNYYLMVGNTIEPSIRKSVINAFMELTNYFTMGAFSKVLSEQNSSIESKNYYNEKEAFNEATEKLSKEDSIINFNQLNDKAFIFINNDGQSFTIITNAPKKSKIYQNLDKLFNSGAKFGAEKEQHLTIPDFASMKTNEEFLEVIEKIMDNHTDIQILRNKLGSYVFNADNFFKMVQILLRLRTGVPVLIMGETGCGKTSLINAIATINNYKMLIFNIHAGVNDNEIVQFMKKNNLLEKDIGYDEFEDDIDNIIFDEDNNDNSNLKKNLKNNNIELDKKENNNEQFIIVFFDEFNTCNSLGLLTEIMCSRKCQGINVKKNVVFSGACNPYRKIDKELEEKNRVGSTALIKENSLNYNNKLVYAVNPLPYTQLYYIFNFGNLSEEVERKYIYSIVDAEIYEYINDKSKLEHIKKLMVESFMKAQIFIKERNGKESVSLRETRKFMTIYKFLIKDFRRKVELCKNYFHNGENNIEIENRCYKFYLDKDEDELAHKYCIAATIYICFYIRIYNSKDKIDFQKLMNKLLSLEFISYPNQLQDELISNIKIEKGIAPNESLRLNLFILFIGIMTKIAIFLVGPPGCSKTLCFNILKREMKGNLSKSKFWKEYPQLIVTSYQGSLTSTSKGIIDAFKDGEKKLKEFSKRNNNLKKSEKEKGVIICVFIDEIGLCEIAPSNPLKALHVYLELDYKNNKDEKLAFVGISNWKLDAAKMNRGIYLNVINPISDIGQMYKTASHITNIYDKAFCYKYEELLINLSKVIYNYNSYLNDIHSEFINFHGTRDFYNLIKTTAKKIIEKAHNDEIESALFSIESNYNGVTKNEGFDSADFIKTKFKEFYPNFQGKDKFGIEECIKNNILDEEDSRYLLLIMKSNLSQYLILNILKELKDENKIVYFLGSLFEDDIYNEAYSAKAINKIQYYLEQDIILILKNLSTTYASLYDLFNQRFSIIRNKKFIEISLGEVTNTALVNDNLKIIVFIREEAVKMQDPPFLNRFEKYYISFDNLLDETTRPIANKILDLRKIFKNPKKKIKYHFENELINFYDEEIKSMILDYKIHLEKNQEINEEEITDKILENVARIMPQELIVFLNHYRIKTYKNIVEKINYYYLRTIHTNIKAFLENCKNAINIIYTFTPTVRSNKFNNFSIENEIVGNINSNNIKIIYINLIKTEHQLEMDISDFYESENKLLLINFEENVSDNLEFVLMFLQRYQKDKKIKDKKLIIILIHLLRKNQSFNKDIFVPTLSELNQTFIDNLYGKDLIITKILNLNIRELYQNKLLINLNELLQNELYTCFKKIDYSFDDSSIKENEYIGSVINYITHNEKLMKRIIDIILNDIEKNQQNDIEENEVKIWNIYDYIFENEQFLSKEDYLTIFIKVLEERFLKLLSKFIVHEEKLSIFSSLISKKELPKKAIEIWENLLDEFNFSRDINDKLKSNKVKLSSGLNLPSIETIRFCKKILERDNIKKYFEEENEIRNCRNPEDIIQENEEELDNEGNEEFEEAIREKKKLIKEFFNKDNTDINLPKFEVIKEEIKKFFIPNDKLVNDIKSQIEKDKFIKKLKEKNDKNLFELFFEDYKSQFISSIMRDKKLLYFKILNYLIELRFEKNKEKKSINDSLISFTKNIIWSQIYKDKLIFIIKIIEITHACFPEIDIMEKIMNKINKKEIDYIISSHHPRHKRLINKPFLLILDSLFLNLIELIEKSESKDVLEKMNFYFEIIQNAEIYNSDLNLKSKDFYRFKTLYNIIKILNDKKAYNQNDINEYIKYIKIERKIIIENKTKEISELLIKQINFLNKIIPKCEEKSKVIMKILISKYKEIINLDCRETLCDIILNKDNKDLLKFSNEFFIYILDLFDFTPESLKYEDDDIVNPFSKAIKKNKNYSLLNKINEKLNGVLSENFKYIFKYKITQYYNNEIEKLGNNLDTDKKIKDEIEIYLGEDSQNYFKNCHKTLIEILKGHNEQITNGNIKEVFCIVYCNIFLEKFVYYLIEQKTYISTRKNEIIKFLSEGKDEIKKSFKLFILKELKSKYIKERTKFLNVEEWKQLYNLKDLFPDLRFNKTKNKELHGILDIPFYSGEDINDFLREKEERIINTCKYTNIDDKQFIYNIDLFINENLSLLRTNAGYNQCFNSNLMTNFKFYVNENKKYSNGTKKLINLFFDKNIYNRNMQKTVQETEYFEIVLYAYRFSILSSLAEDDSIYSMMINKNCIKNISKSYIPGADLYCDQWVESYLNMKTIIKERREEGGSCRGYYICDCGEYYFQVPCGLPMDISYCANCQKPIGGINQKLVIRKEDKGVYKIKRIYPDRNNKRAVESRMDLKRIYGKNFYPSELFDEFEKKMIAELEKNYKGILEQSYLHFINETKNVRKLDRISYRLLSFIIYSNIYFAYKCGFITLEELNSYKIVPIKESRFNGNYDDDTYSYNNYRCDLLSKRRKGLDIQNADNYIIRVLNKNWFILQKELRANGVDNIKIFLNLIFKDLFDVILNSSDMSTEERRDEFELKINFLIIEKIKEYSNKAKNYMRDLESIYENNLEQEYLILERNTKIDFVEKDYPYYYELLSIPLINTKDIIEIFNSIKNSNKKYTVLYHYLTTNHKEIKYLETFSQINNFVNYTISHYSNLISRKEATKRILKKEIENKEIPKSICNEFLKAYNKYKLYEIANQYECHSLKEIVKQKELDLDDTLSCFLIDNGVQGQGMKLAALYSEYTKYQNSFLDKIISNIDEDNKKLKYLTEKISEKINPQKANQYNIISFNISKENYSFLEMLLFYSYKDSFDSNGKYDFSKKDKIKYNLEEIEEELEGLLLPGKKFLNDKLEFVIYQFEGFRSDNSQILLGFIEKYPQINLDEEQKQILFNFKNEQYSIDILTKILFSMQLMISYYHENIFENEQTVYETFQEFPDYFKINEEIKSLFFNNKQFKLKHLLYVYEYFELLCFSEFKKNLDPCYNSNEDISNEKKEKLEKYFKEKPEHFITKINIATAVRRFISRYLVGIREDTDINIDDELFLNLRNDCWDNELLINQVLFERSLEELKKVGIKVKEGLRLYEYLGGDDDLLGNAVKNHIIEQEEKEKEEINRNAKKKKGKKQKRLKETF